jgi:hypothetical protein
LPDIPTVTFTRLYGFIDILNHMGGKADVAVISSKEQLELTDILPILETLLLLNSKRKVWSSSLEATCIIKRFKLYSTPH